MKSFTLYPLVVLALLLLHTTASSAQKKQIKTLTSTSKIHPFSDPTNEGNWILNEEISDEFEGTEIDTTKWFVEGQNGDYYIWKGRAPSQFAPHNVIVEDGVLKLRTQWEPDYPFAKENYADGSTLR